MSIFCIYKLKNLFNFWLIFISLLFCLAVYPAIASDNQELVEIQKKLQTTFSNLTVVDFRPSPIPNLFEINLGNKIIYYYPEKDLMLFGELFSKDGISLTGESLARQTEETLKQAALSSGLLLGSTEGVEILEFVDPDCPYSQRADEFLRSLAQQHQFSRKVFFDLRAHPQAKEKALYVLCSDDPDKALLQVFTRESVALLSSKTAEETLKKQAQAAEKLGILGTPSFLISGKLLAGFKPEELLDCLQKQQLINKKEEESGLQKK